MVFMGSPTKPNGGDDFGTLSSARGRTQVLGVVWGEVTLDIGKWLGWAPIALFHEKCS